MKLAIEIDLADPRIATGSLDVLELVEREAIVQTLALCGGNVSAAAELLDLHRQSLQRKINRLGIGTQPSSAPADTAGHGPAPRVLARITPTERPRTR